MRTTCDIHAHLAPTVGSWQAGGPPALRDPDALLAWLDRAGIDRAVVSVPPPAYRQGQVDAAVWAPALNDAMADLLDRHDRLLHAAYLPLEAPSVALAEAQRWSGRAAAFTGGAGGASVPLQDPVFEPLWGHLARSGRGLILHPGSTPDTRLDPFYLSNLLGNPAETGVAVAQLVFGRVLTRHPELKVAVVHCGGVVPAVAGRWAHGVATARPGVDPDTDVAGQLRRLWSDCLSHDPDLVTLAERTFGGEHLLLGSDWPFPMGLDDPLGALSEADRVRVGVDNPARFLDGGES